MKKANQINARGIFMVLVAAGFITLFNNNILNVALSKIMEDFNISSGTGQWVITIYMIVTSVMVPITAFLIESFRTRYIFLGSMILFLIGSILCAISSSFPMLIISRTVQALGAGVIIPLMMNTVLVIAPEDKVGTYMSVCMCSLTLGSAASQIFSGVILKYFNWNALFIILIPVIIILSIMGAKTMSDTSKLTYPKLDFISVILSTVGLGSLIYGINAISSGTGDKKVISLIVVLGAILMAIFVVRQKKLKDPMLNLSPLKCPDFVMGVILIMIVMATIFTMNVMIPIYMQGSLGVSSFTAALALLPSILGNAFVTPIIGKIYDKKGIKVLLPLGLILVTTFVFIISRVGSNTPIIFITIVYAVMYSSVALVMAPAQTHSLSSLSKEYYPHGVAILNTLQQLAGAIGSAFFIGIMSGAQDKALNSGKLLQDAVAAGFSKAAVVNGIIGLIGVVIAFVFVNRSKEKKEVLRESEVF